MKAEVLQAAYTGGSIQDIPRHMLPAGAVWKLSDFIPDLAGAPVQKRGGWGRGSSLSSASYISACAWTPFSSGATVLVAIDDRGHLFAYDGSSWTDKGGVGSDDYVATVRPIFFNDQLFILEPASSEADGLYGPPAVYDGSSAPSDLTASGSSVIPLGCPWGLSYKSRLVIASPTTIYFSEVLDPTSWDVDSFVKPTDPVTGLAGLSNMIMIFSEGRCERLRGTTPPSSTSDGDFTLEPAFAEGCIDARSIVVFNDQIFWANGNGVHISDGASSVNIIETGGLKNYWAGLMAEFEPGWTFAAGIYQGRYFLTVMSDTRVLLVTLVYDLAAKAWSFWTNIPALMFAESYGAQPELYMALGGSNALGHLASCFFPASTNASDGDGTNVEPFIEFPYFRAGTGSSRWRDLFIGVDIDDETGDAATLNFQYTTTPDGTAYTTVEDDDGGTIEIGGTSGYERVRIPLNLAAQGIGLKVTQGGKSAKTAIFDLEAVVHDREGRY